MDGAGSSKNFPISQTILFAALKLKKKSRIDNLKELLLKNKQNFR